MTIFWDSETFLITPGLQAPPAVCFQWCDDSGEAQIVHVRDARPLIEQWFSNERVVLHNAGFDCAVVCAQWPDLTPLVFQAYAEDRVTCTQIRERLIAIATGRGKQKLPYDLGSISKRYDGPELNKADPWRMRYAELLPLPVDQWPEEARAYALNDALATRHVYQAQEAFADLLLDQYRQARAGFWLRLMECWGLRTDPAQVARYLEQVQVGLVADRKLATDAGLLRPDGTRNTKAAQEYMRKLCEAEGAEPPLTDGGAVSLAEEAIEEYADDVLEAYANYATAKTRVARAEKLQHSPIQASFNVLVDTGRTSCRQGNYKGESTPSAWGFQVQNPSKDKGLRECFIARPGCALVSIDYDALELHTFAQVCLWALGQSKLADVLNEGRDPHTELAATLAGISVEAAYQAKKEDKSFNGGYRFFAKAANFGFPGGMGPAKFVKSLVKQAVHGGDEATIKRAKNYDEADARQLRDAWMQTWPEARPYFQWINSLLNGQETTTITHFVSKRVRGGVYYTQACNSFFQGLGADIKKDAFFRIAREAYCDRSSPLWGTRTVNDVHDEWIGEVPLGRLHEAAFRARDILVQTAEEWCPDLKYTAEPAAMLAWSKSAEKVISPDGKLTPWKPGG